MRRQIRNRGIRFARGATGPYANKAGPRKHIRSTGSNKAGTFELVTNGTFGTDIQGWTGNNAILSWVSELDGRNGLLKIEDAGGFTNAYQEITTVVGAKYRARCWVYSEPSPAFLVIANGTQDVNSFDNIASVSSTTTSVWEYLTVDFTAEETISRVKLHTGSVNVAHYDDVSVRRI